ncbi:HEAT repeat domain-containing protein [Streptomyces huasconensis]|nr:HEAT repeat domain-containing protein [Streptomyces sp. JCM 35825]UFQ20422.1 HEAT repeat domain-containing protein [Streptomyces huasconensis]WCL90030.1 HEAT repeat domain-containing protein [Streptomyces sp. JCM 35825]
MAGRWRTAGYEGRGVSGESLIEAVRRGDAQAVDVLLEAGADPDSADACGTSALRLAVDAFDLNTVEALLASSRLHHTAADGHSPLLRAIDRGACDITETLIRHGASLSVQDGEGRDALALARHWHRTGAANELRRRSGRPGPIQRGAVRSASGATCEELSLGGLTVRTGHTAILTMLEPRYGILPSFEELLSRALEEPDVDHEVWEATTLVLQQRHDPAIWDAAAALRDRADPLERYFGAEVLRVINLLDESDDLPFDAPLVDLFVPWVAQEPDPRVAGALTAGLADALDSRAEEPLTMLARHSDSKVRQWAVSGLHHAAETEDSKALAALTQGTKDECAAVRQAACRAIADAPPHAEGASEALASCLTDTDENVRVEAAVRLALRDDPRGDAVLDGLDATDRNSPYHWLLYDVHRHRTWGR